MKISFRMCVCVRERERTRTKTKQAAREKQELISAYDSPLSWLYFLPVE